MSRLWRRALTRPELLLLSAAYLAFRSRFLDFVPLWDGTVYYYFARYASFRHLDPLRAEVHNHISPVFISLMHLPEVLAPGDVRAFNAALALVGLAAILAFHGLLGWATAGRLTRAEMLLVTALFAFHPVVLASSINLNLDIGVLAFFLLHTLSVVRERFALAAVWGIGLVFSKETGVLLLPLSAASLLLVDRGRRRRTWLAEVAPALLVPALFYATYLFYKTGIRGRPLFWEGLGSGPTLVRRLLDPFQADAYLATQLLQLFVLQFHWVLTGLGLALAGSYLLRRRRMRAARAERLRVNGTALDWSRARPLVVDIVHQRLAFSAVLFVAALYLLTRFRPYSNPRYLLPLFALLLLLLGQLLAVGVQRRGLRLVAAAAILLGLFGPSLEATVDPLSRRLLGTFDFGRHPMLRMTALTGECCGAGRDQLVYNLQFMRFGELQDHVYRALRPTRETVILVTRAANFALLGSLSVDDYSRSVASPSTFSPRYASAEDFLRETTGMDNVYFLAFPNVDNRAALAALGRAFGERRLMHYEWRGYALDVYRFSNAASLPTTRSPDRRNNGPETGSDRPADGIPRPPR